MDRKLAKVFNDFNPVANAGDPDKARFKRPLKRAESCIIEFRTSQLEHRSHPGILYWIKLSKVDHQVDG